MELIFKNPRFTSYGYSYKTDETTYSVEFTHKGIKGFFEAIIDFETGKHEVTVLRLKGVRKFAEKAAIASDDNKDKAMNAFMGIIVKGKLDSEDYLTKRVTKMQS